MCFSREISTILLVHHLVVQLLSHTLCIFLIIILIMFYILFFLLYFILYIFRLNNNKIKWIGKDVKVWCSDGIIQLVQKKYDLWKKLIFIRIYLDLVYYSHLREIGRLGREGAQEKKKPNYITINNTLTSPLNHTRPTPPNLPHVSP